MIKLNHIKKIVEYKKGDLCILDDISLEIAPGEMVACIGKSGAGKSTLLSILGLLERASGGNYFFLAQDITTLNDKQLAYFRNHYLGFIFQSAHLIPHLSVIENVSLPLVYSKFSSKLSAIKAQAALEKVGMSAFINTSPKTLSGGEALRVAIARGLINDPKLLLADEPTSALDTKTATDIIQLFKTLNQAGQTIVMVTHDTTISRKATRIIRLNEGKLLNQTNSAHPNKYR